MTASEEKILLIIIVHFNLACCGGSLNDLLGMWLYLTAYLEELKSECGWLAWKKLCFKMIALTLFILNQAGLESTLETTVVLTFVDLRLSQHNPHSGDKTQCPCPYPNHMVGMYTRKTKYCSTWNWQETS